MNQVIAALSDGRLPPWRVENELESHGPERFRLAAEARRAWLEQLTGHPLHRQRGAFHTVDDPERGPVTLPRLPVDSPPRETPAPRLGQHTDEVLAEAGLTGEELRRLREQQVIA